RPPRTATCRCSVGTKASGCSSRWASRSTGACSASPRWVAGCPSAPIARAASGAGKKCGAASSSTSRTRGFATSSPTRISRERAMGHASHFVHLLQSLAQQQADRGGEGIIVAPFDTELFGHWWFEGADFLAATYRALRGSGKDGVRAVTASQHLEAHAPGRALQLAEGSWGANGDHSMWLNDQTAWTWERLWRLEDAFWDAARAALASPAARPVLAQAARELLLAQASDWQSHVSISYAVFCLKKEKPTHDGAAY